MNRTWVAAGLAVLLASGVARADDASDKSDKSDNDRSGWRAYKAGGDLLKGAPIAALIDGSWSLATQLDTTLIDHTWTSPRPFGTLGHYSRRILYGTSWTLMLTMEAAFLAIGSHGDFSWMAELRYRTDWMIPFDAPDCTHIGDQGGCGVGLGSVTFIQFRPEGTHWWFEAGGGWFEQRLLDDPLRTVTDSTWVLSPFSALYQFKTNPSKPIALDTYIGPGVYGGMHNASIHPTVKGQDVYNFPWTEFVPLEGGIGPGARAEIDVIFGGHVEAHVDATISAFLLGGTNEHPNHAVAPLDFRHDGIPIWRRANVGIGYVDWQKMPMKPSFELFGAELSERRVDRLGYRGVMLRFDVPLRALGSGGAAQRP